MTMTRLVFVLVLYQLVAPITCVLSPDHQQGLCSRPDCDCPDSGHPSWTMVNCTVAPTQKLDIYDGDLSDTTTDIIVTGAEALTFHPGALSRLKDIRHVRLSGAKLVVLRQDVAVNLNVVSALLEIDNCIVLRVEEHAFNNIRGLAHNGTEETERLANNETEETERLAHNGSEDIERPLTVNIRNCDTVILAGEAFSWLLKISISNVKTLTLSPRAFLLDPTAANVGEHGPGMSIELTNLTAPEFPEQTFGSSAVEIIMTRLKVQAIRPRAFSANTYNVIMATDCSFHLIQGEAFTQPSLINNLYFSGCTIHQLASRALQSAITKLNISKTRFDIIETGAINATVASVRIADCEFHIFYTKGFELLSWNKLYMGKNEFDALPPNAIVAPPSSIVNELYFAENEIENVAANSLEFMGQTFASKYGFNVVYLDNYYGVPCHCNISAWLAEAMGSKDGEPYDSQSYCTVDEFFARCFNVPQQNMLFNRFYTKVCSEAAKNIQCEKYKTKSDVPTEIKNPRFPHKKLEDSLSERDKKVIGIVIVTALGCIIIVMFVSLIRWMKRKGYCASIKNLLMSSNTSCGTICGNLCVCGRNNGLDNARSISQLSVNEYSERRRLNEPRVQDNVVMETVLPTPYAEEVTTPTDDKTTQTLPEELTKELLENLKEKLEDPENYVEAREMIEHLYELIKVEESCNTSSPVIVKTEENIYDIPFQNTTPRIGKNKKQMISVGTKAPSLDKLLPLSPYNRQTALAHEYFEPKDFAVHLYAEITNCDKEKRSLLGTIPDIVEQVVPRGPYLRAVREKKSSPTFSPPSKSLNASPAKTPISSSKGSQLTSPIKSPSSIKSSKSTASNSSGKMINRPLPEKPNSMDPGEGPSVALG